MNSFDFSALYSVRYAYFDAASNELLVVCSNAGDTYYFITAIPLVAGVGFNINARYTKYTFHVSGSPSKLAPRIPRVSRQKDGKFYVVY
jgi:hypothetical protein